MWFCPQCAAQRSDAESVCSGCGATAVANPHGNRPANPFADRDESGPADSLDAPNRLPPGLEPAELEIPGKATAEELLVQSESLSNDLESYAPYQSPRCVNSSMDPDPDPDPDSDDVDSEAEQLERKARLAEAADEVRQFSTRISLREVLALMTFLAIVFSFLMNFGEYGVGIVLLILFVNLCGIILGLMITHLGGLPNDGG